MHKLLHKKETGVIMPMLKTKEYHKNNDKLYTIPRSARRTGGVNELFLWFVFSTGTSSVGIFVLGNSQRRGLPSPRPHNNLIASKLRVRSVSYFGRSEQMKRFSSVVSNDRTRRKGIHPSASHRQKMTEGLDPSVAPVTKPLTLLSCLGG